MTLDNGKNSQVAKGFMVDECNAMDLHNSDGQDCQNLVVENLKHKSANSEKNQKDAKKRAKKRTKKEEEDLFQQIVQETKNGVPDLEIALRFGIRISYVHNALIRMFKESKEDFVFPKYELVSSGISLNKLPKVSAIFGKYVTIKYDIALKTIAVSSYVDDNNKNKEKLKKLTRSEEEEVFKSVSDAYNAGFPEFEIMRQFGIGASLLKKFLLRYLKEGNSPVMPEYEIVTAGTMIRQIPNLPDNFGEYVKVKYANDGSSIILSAYSQE